MANDFQALTSDELYLLHLEVAAVLREKLVAEKNALEERLQRTASAQWSRDHATTSALPTGKSKISESGSTFRKLVRTWQAAALAGRAVEVRKTDRRLSD